MNQVMLVMSQSIRRKEGLYFKESVEPQERKVPNNNDSALHCKAAKKKGGKNSNLRVNAPELNPLLQHKC